MEKRTVPEAFHPAEYIREEAEERGWTPSDLADILGLSRVEVSNMLKGRVAISADTAKALGDAFGTGAQVWLNLQSAHELAISDRPDDAVKKRALLYEKAPIREMQKRGWIEETKNIEILEARYCELCGIDDPSKEVQFAHAARKSEDYKEANNLQLIWLARAKQLAERMVGIPKYSHSNFKKLEAELTGLKAEPESATLIPGLLAEYGIRFLIVEHLRKAKIDGACFWLCSGSPVVVVSLRYDRIDYFWFTLAHELMHIKNKDGTKLLLVETSLVGDDAQPDEEKNDTEKLADDLARKFLVDQNALQDFVVRREPYFSKKDIRSFARVNNVHPGIVVGQLHYLGAIPYRNFRPMLVKIRDIITSTAVTDGWGSILTI